MGTVRNRTRRSAFTLVELIMVIGIIVVLASLLLVGLRAAQQRAYAAQTGTEIAQLATAQAAARQALNNVEYLPSQIRLYAGYSDYNTDGSAIALNSRAFLFRAFGTKLWGGPPSYSTPVQWGPTLFTPASGTPAADGTLPGGVTLYADQSLVFWLGGIPTAAGPGGFSNNPTNPAAVGQGLTTRGPFYQFPFDRLSTLGNGFCQFIDAFSTNPPVQSPYLYFSSSKTGNDYNFYDAGPLNVPISYGVWPYFNAGGTVLPILYISTGTGSTGNPTTIVTTGASALTNTVQAGQLISVTGAPGMQSVAGTWQVVGVTQNTGPGPVTVQGKSFPPPTQSVTVALPASATVPLTSGMYAGGGNLGLMPFYQVIGVSTASTTTSGLPPYTITVTTGGGLYTVGESVFIRDVAGATAVNGTWTVAGAPAPAPGAGTFSIYSYTAPGTYTAGTGVAGLGPTYYLSQGFQIISAGKNRLFGPGGPWSATQGYFAGTNGVDDQSNFSSTSLGVGQN